MAGFFDALANPKMPGETDSEYESRKRREAAAKPAADARKAAEDAAAAKRKKSQDSDYPSKFNDFMSWLKGG